MSSKRVLRIGCTMPGTGTAHVPVTIQAVLAAIKKFSPEDLAKLKAHVAPRAAAATVQPRDLAAPEPPSLTDAILKDRAREAGDILLRMRLREVERLEQALRVEPPTK